MQKKKICLFAAFTECIEIIHISCWTGQNFLTLILAKALEHKKEVRVVWRLTDADDLIS